MPHVQLTEDEHKKPDDCLTQMKDEYKQLGLKIGKLGVFAIDTNSDFMSLPIAEREDILDQLISMENYHIYLGRRIERATK